METLDYIWLYSNKKSKYDAHFKLLIDSGMYVEEPVPSVVNLKDQESEVTSYYLKRLKEEYKGIIVILDDEKVFISKDNKLLVEA